jgi:hypothetical protein
MAVHDNIVHFTNSDEAYNAIRKGIEHQLIEGFVTAPGLAAGALSELRREAVRLDHQGDEIRAQVPA